MIIQLIVYFLEDCVPFDAEDNRQHLIPREEYKTEYQWKLDGRKVINKKDFQERSFYINSGIKKTYKYYHRDNTILI